jgi:outer membrane protein assembly factor BamD
MHVNRLILTRLCAVGAVCGLLAISAGCASSGSTIPKGVTTEADKFLYDKGTEALNKKKWMKAREYFRQLVDNYPQSQYRPDAKVGLGDTYLGENTLEALILAVNEYREFLTFYPTSRRADYAQYKLGYAHFAQMLAAQRDQTQTREAVKEFETFVERYPNSSLMPEARKKLRETQDRLSDSDYQVGYFYYRSRWYPGAVERFRAVLKTDPGYSNRDALYYFLADAYVKMNRKAEAVPLVDRLIKEFEKSEYLEKAKKLMVDLQSAEAAPEAKAQKKRP